MVYIRIQIHDYVEMKCHSTIFWTVFNPRILLTPLLKIIWICMQSFISRLCVLFISLSVFMSTPYCFDYDNIVLSLETGEFSDFVLFVSFCFVLNISLAILFSVYSWFLRVSHGLPPSIYVTFFAPFLSPMVFW